MELFYLTGKISLLTDAARVLEKQVAHFIASANALVIFTLNCGR